MRRHVLMFMALDAVLLCLVTGLSGCARGGDEFTFVSEFILLCKRGAGTVFLPWLCWVVFVAVMWFQLPWMFEVAQVAVRRSGESVAKSSPPFDVHGAFLWWVWAAVLGFLLVVVFDWRDRGPAEIWLHRTGVVALSAGLFVTLHLVWLQLKIAESNANLQETKVHASPSQWVGYDVVFVVVLLVFMLTSLLGTNQTVSTASEYAAFAMLFMQTTWLLLACWESKKKEEIGALSGTGLPFAANVALVLLAYGAASGVVVLIVGGLRA